MNFAFDVDAFSSGQIDSKIWLASALENVLDSEKIRNRELTAWILAGWYASVAQILYARGRTNINFTSYDIDPVATQGAEIYCEPLIRQQKFRTVTKNVETLDYRFAPDIVINTSTEHFLDTKWWDIIPRGTLVALQSNDMVHPGEETQFCNSVADLLKRYPVDAGARSYVGEMKFHFGDWEFTRYMAIGRKS
jgi:hypothetical protein